MLEHKDGQQKKEVKPPLLVIKNLSKSDIPGVLAVDDVNLTVNKGEIFALLGSSGCGKSTLLRMLAGFEKPTSGKIILDGQDLSNVPPYKRPVNMMFQSYALFPHMTVWNNIAFGLKQKHMPKDEIKENVEQMLALVHMEEYADRKPHQLSGGQRQRVALARSLATHPKLLLLDEPMGALDKKLRTKMQLELVDIIEKVGVTCIMVTHDQQEAMTMAERVAIMDCGEFLQVGDPEEIYENPNCRFTAEFIGSVNLFDGVLGENGSDFMYVECPALQNKIYIDAGAAIADGMKLSVAIRPEKITLSKEKPQQECNFEEGIVDNIAYMGDVSIYLIKLQSGMIVRTTLPNVDRFRKNQPTWDDKVFISWEPDSCIVLTI